jgi:type III restriction enzyme
LRRNSRSREVTSPEWRAARIFSPDIAKTYVEHLAQQVASVDDDPEEFLEAIVEAPVTVAGLGLVT